MGLGKTISTLKALEMLLLVEPAPILVIAPIRVVLSTWPDEIKKWNLNMDYVAIVGTSAEKAKAVESKSHIYGTNYENLPWLVDWYSGRPWPFKIVVADEVTRLKGFRTRQGTKRAKALSEVAHKSVTRWIGLTGTPAPNGVKDLWGPMWFVDSGKRLGKSYTAFENRWFKPTPDGYGIEPLPHAQSEIQSRIADVCLALEAKDYFDLKEPIVSKIAVNLPPKAFIQYKEMEKKMFLELEGHLGPTEIEAHNAASKTQKCLQLANGAIYTDEDKNWVVVHDVKIQALESVVEEANGTPILVAYHFRHDLVRLRSAFPNSRVLDDNPKTVEDWNQGKIPILIGSAGHGLSLQHGGNIICFFSLDWNLENHMQIIERIGPTRQIQSGYDRPVFICYILANGTLDYEVLERIETKASVQSILMKAMKSRGKR
jgi:SNF2 family DNA or RNA helicase